jgi:hypothetical protein
MNSLEAKFILEACRAGNLDAADPKVAEALQAMQSDAELARWFAATQELDRAAGSLGTHSRRRIDLGVAISSVESAALDRLGRSSRCPGDACHTHPYQSQDG